MKISVPVVVALFALALASKPNPDLVINDLKRVIDLTSNVVRISAVAEFANTGSSSAPLVHLPVPKQFASHLSHLSYSDEEGTPLAHSPVVDGYVTVTIPGGIAPGSTTTLTANIALTGVVHPFPASITQADSQLVKYSDSLYAIAPYHVKTQITEVKLPSQVIESKTEVEPTNVKGDVIEYGPYEDIAPGTFAPLEVHFENNNAFATSTSVVKEVEVSHWGNVAVEETYQVRHSGAVLKGGFSRHDLQRNPSGSGVSSFRSLVAHLPASARDLYFRDEIGNISSSHARFDDNEVEFEVQMRFPMFGGWKTEFYVGYNLPTSGFLFTSSANSNVHVLNVTFSAAFDSAPIEDFTLHVILPEGARNAKIVAPFALDSESTTTRYTYLDTDGRPVLVAKKSNLVAEHNQYFQVVYEISGSTIYHEPLLLIGAFFLFFVVCMVNARFELSISTTDNADATAAKLTALKRWNGTWKRRQELRQELEAAAERMVKSGNAEAYAEARGKVENSLKRQTAEADALVKDIAKLDSAAADVLSNISTKEKQLLTTVLALHQAHKAHHADGKMAKAQYDDKVAMDNNTIKRMELELDSLLMQFSK